MKTTRILTTCVLTLGLMVCQARLSKAEPMGTAFTYQGRLIDNNQPADGLYDFQFKLFDNIVKGKQVGTDVNVADVDVIDGYFTVELDFGKGAFDGNARWLEIGVRPGDMNDPNAFVTLSPRQEVTPTPYALYAKTAGSGGGDNLGNHTATQNIRLNGYWLSGDGGNEGVYVANNGNVGIGTTSPLWALEVANPMPGNAAESAVTADDAGGAIAAYSSTFSTFPHLADRVSLFSNYLTAAGLDLRADGVTSDIRFYTGGITPSYERIRITSSGNVGIGTTNPGAKLEVKQNDWRDIVKVGTPDTSNRLILSSGPDYASISGGQTNQNSIMISHSTGNVGIGPSLSLPQAKLQVNGDLKVKGDVAVDGAYVGSFPRPAYDTGWVPLLQGQELLCIHNLGGNVDNYVVDLTFKDLSGSINNCRIGGDNYNWGEQWISSGAYWSELTTSSIKVYRNTIDQSAKQVRIRIWVYK